MLYHKLIYIKEIMKSDLNKTNLKVQLKLIHFHYYYCVCVSVSLCVCAYGH